MEKVDEKIFDKINRQSIFTYCVVLCVIMYIFSKINIGLNIIFATIIIYVLIKYLYNDEVIQKKINNQILNNKKKIILPKPIDSEEYDEIVNFLFSIQDFYVYNPIAYEEMVQNIDYFIKAYEEVINNNSLASTHYAILDDSKREALNSLQSIVYNMKPHQEYDKKLSLAIKTLNNILNKYVQEILYIDRQNKFNNGMTTKTFLINTYKTVPYNYYQNDKITYDIY